MTQKTKKQIKREVAKEANRDRRAEERADATTRYRMCINHQILEMLSTLITISATKAIKVFGNIEYRIGSVDGNEHAITLFTNKLWDLILLKLTEVVHYDTHRNQFDWYKKSDRYKDNDEEGDNKEWYIYFSIQTIAECLGVTISVDSLTKLYDRIIEATKVLQNISVTVTKGKNRTKIDGYLDAAGVRDGSDIEDSIMKSNACFAFLINPRLIAYLDTLRLPLYHFNHSWLHFSGRNENAYAAAKRFGRLYSQNTRNCHTPENIVVSMTIATLKQHLPRLNSKDGTDNRVTLDNALQSIPDAFHLYIDGDQKITFEELTKLRLRGAKYDRTNVIVRFLSHPNTSSNEVTRNRITDMNDDALLLNRQFYRLEESDELINHKGILKRLVKRLKSSSNETDAGLQDADETAATAMGSTATGNGVPDEGTLFPDGRIVFADGSIRLPDGRIIRRVTMPPKQNVPAEER